MKKLFFFTSALCTLAFATLVFQSCNKDAIEVIYEDPTKDLTDGGEEGPEPPATLSFSSLELALKGEAGSKSMIAITNVKKVTAQVEAGKTWCTVTVSGNLLTFSAADNNTGSEQTANVTVTAEALDDPTNKTTKVIAVTQANKQASITFTQTTMSDCLGAAGNVELTFTSNVTQFAAVTRTPNDSWCSATFTGNKMVVALGENTTGGTRTAIIDVTAGSGTNTATAMITIHQQDKSLDPVVAPELTFTTDTYTAFGSADEFKVTFTTNASTVTAATRAPNNSWCTATISGTTMTVVVGANPGSSLRTAIIDVTAGTGGNTTVVPITINQQNPALDPKWRVGDLVDLSGTSGNPADKGVLYWVSADMTKGEIVSLDIAVKTWSKVDFGVAGGMATGATQDETTDITAANTKRAANHNAVHTAWTGATLNKSTFDVDFPAFAHCEAKGTGWYLPSVIDCKTFLESIDKMATDNATFKTKLTTNGCTVVDATPASAYTAYFYTNREDGGAAAKAIVVDLRQTNVNFKQTSSQNKHGSGRATRCVKSVTLP